MNKVGWLGMQDNRQRYCYYVSRHRKTKSEVWYVIEMSLGCNASGRFGSVHFECHYRKEKKKY